MGRKFNCEALRPFADGREFTLRDYCEIYDLPTETQVGGNNKVASKLSRLTKAGYLHHRMEVHGWKRKAIYTITEKLLNLLNEQKIEK